MTRAPGTPSNESPSHPHICLALTLTATFFYFPANFFPFMTIEMYGQRNTTTIWQGIVALMDHQSYAVAIVVFLASILIPIIKLLILFYLSITAGNGQRLAFKNYLYRFVEAVGRWSMLDIFLLAILVALVKLRPLANVEPERGSTLFLMVVIFTMLASAYFDPRHLEECDDNPEKSN